ncbi:hypothetical protein Vsou_06180 [Vulcanisaeta souniana JCM 11219]|uniref:Transcriptional regulator n=3 Tax=Vulcanisaeta souniana TaxID=164452 RepID=A0ABM8BKJ3_9CREN|nr:hypothetical protein Vsou_06180 [Vulcanisaeta souniana JCM 11219]
MQLKKYYLDNDLQFLLTAMTKLLFYVPCAKFTDLMRVTSWHQQKLSRILDKGIKMGFIIKCVSGEGYDLALPVSRRSLISRGKIVLNVNELTDNYLIMKHNVSITMQNTGLVDINNVFIRVYGDIDWDEPLRFRCGDVKVMERLERDKCPLNMCNLVFNLGKPMAPGSTFNYNYSFNLYYYPPRDYFSLDILNNIKDIIIRIPRSYGINGRISLGDVELTGYGSVRTSISKRYNIVHGISLTPPGTLKIPIQI